MLAALLTTLLSRKFPNVPKWVLKVVARALPQFVDLGKEVATYQGYETRMAMALDGVEQILDDSFDDVPYWSDLNESDRDDILETVANVVLIVGRLVQARMGGAQ